METILRDLVYNLRAKQTDALTAAMVIQQAVMLARNEPDPKKAVEDVLRRIAAGPDGLPGTDDDIITPQIVEGCVKILDSGLLNDFVDVLLTYVGNSSSTYTWLCRCFKPQASS